MTTRTAKVQIAQGEKPGVKVQEKLTPDILAEQYLDPVYAYIVRRVGDPNLAEDLAIETLQDAMRSLKRRRGEPLPWLYGIARRKVVDALRRRKRRPETSLDAAREITADANENPQTQAIRNETMSAFKVLLSELPETQREVLLLQHLEGLDVRAIALVVGKSPIAVNSALQRARKTLLRRATELGIEVIEVNP